MIIKPKKKFFSKSELYDLYVYQSSYNYNDWLIKTMIDKFLALSKDVILIDIYNITRFHSNIDSFVIEIDFDAKDKCFYWYSYKGFSFIPERKFSIGSNDLIKTNNLMLSIAFKIHKNRLIIDLYATTYKFDKYDLDASLLCIAKVDFLSWEASKDYVSGVFTSKNCIKYLRYLFDLITWLKTKVSVPFISLETGVDEYYNDTYNYINFSIE